MAFKIFDKHEEEVILQATSFTSVLMLGAGDRSTITFKTLQEAINASDRKDPYGRGCVVYANNAQGRSVVVDRSKWNFWLQKIAANKSQSVGQALPTLMS